MRTGRIFFAFAVLAFVFGCAAVKLEQQVVIDSRYQQIAHAVCSLSSSPSASVSNSDAEIVGEVEVWVYSRPSGNFLLKVKEGGKVAVLIDISVGDLTPEILNISKQTLEFISDEKAMRQCFIASKFNF